MRIKTSKAFIIVFFLFSNLALSVLIFGSSAEALTKKSSDYCKYSNSNSQSACVVAYKASYKSGKQSSAKCSSSKNEVACSFGARFGKANRKADEVEVKTAAANGFKDGKSKSDTCKYSNASLNSVCKKEYDKQKKDSEAAQRTADSEPFNDCAGVKTYFNFLCEGANSKSGGASNPIVILLITALSWATGLVALATVGAITYGGILYATSQDNSAQTQKGITYVVNSAIGLLLWMSAYAIINFLVPGGLFN